MTEEELYKKVIEKFGVDPQLGIAIEESAERIQAINKYFRIMARPHTEVEEEAAMEKIIEETVDSDITSEQTKIIFPYPASWARWRKIKLDRLKEELTNERT